MKERITNPKNTKAKPKSKPRRNGGGKCDVRNNNSRSNTDQFRDDRQPGDINDANYYFLDDTVKSQITNVSFNEYVGKPFDLFRGNDGSKIQASAPAIMSMHLSPAAGPGNANTNMTGLNLAALNTYTKLSANNAKTTQYGPQDITMLFLAMGQVIAMSSHIARVFGATRLYNVRNRAYPKRVVEALGVGYDNLIANFADYRAEYNSLMTVLSAVPIPSNVPYFAKCGEIYSNIYLDMEGSPMAQTYAFVPYSTWTLNEAGSETGSVLKTTLVHTVGGEPINMNALLAILRSMIEALLQSSTLNYIYSDILRLADKEGLQLLKFSVIPDDYVVLPVYNSEIRKWINNSFMMGAPLSNVEGHTDRNDVVADAATNKIKYNPAFKFDYYGTLQPIMNFDSIPSTDDIVDATRLLAWADTDEAGNSMYIALPDHYLVGSKIHFGDTSVAVQFQVLNTGATNFASVVCAMSNFDWAPIMYIRANNTHNISDYIGDLNYFTTVDGEYLMSLFDMGYQALLSMR